MHIVHLDLERGWRGGQRQVLLLLSELDRRGLSQTLVCRRGSPFLERLAAIAGVRKVPVANRLGALLRLPRRQAGLIFHAHSGNTIPLAVVGALGAGGRSRSIITRRLDLPVHTWLFHRADRVVAISARVRDVLVEAGIPSERVRLIPSAIDRQRHLDPETGRRLRAELGIGESRLIGLTVAALVEQKDPLTLVRALADLPDDYLHVWVGHGELEEKVKRLAVQLGVADKLLLPGFDPDPDRWFSLADLFVLPSLHEGLGSVLLDAFHFGVPVAGTRIPGTGELLEHEVSALLFPPRDPSALAGSIRRLRQDADLSARLVKEGQQRLGAHDIRSAADAYLDLYRELLA
ncbi:MAG: glycosyltransferase [Acidobacteriota bacterium]